MQVEEATRAVQNANEELASLARERDNVLAAVGHDVLRQ